MRLKQWRKNQRLSINTIDNSHPDKEFFSITDEFGITNTFKINAKK